MLYLIDCPCCGDYLAFSPEERHLLTVLLIDPATGLPPDIDPDTGAPCEPSAAAMERAQRRPLCGECRISALATGKLHFTAPPTTGTVLPTVVTSQGPLLDELGDPVLFQCPDEDCGRIVAVIDGRIEDHRARDDDGPLCGSLRCGPRTLRGVGRRDPAAQPPACPRRSGPRSRSWSSSSWNAATAASSHPGPAPTTTWRTCSGSSPTAHATDHSRYYAWHLGRNTARYGR